MCREKKPMDILLRWGVSLGGATLLLAGRLDAFGVGSPIAIGNVDLDTTLPLSKATFWRFARSSDFYRQTRQQSGTVRQEVVDLTNWVQADGTSSTIIDSADRQPELDLASATASALQAQPASAHGRMAGASTLRGMLPRSRHRNHQHQQQQQELDHEQERTRHRPRLWHRRAKLAYAISSPFGSSDATVLQEHTLTEQEDGDGACGICYSEADCITGFPMVSGDLSVKTTFLVTAAADGDPERVRVRIGVVVEEIELPKRLQFLSKKVSKIVGNVGIKQAQEWLAEMIKAGALVAEAA